MSLDKDTVRRIATLARIRVDEDALEECADRLRNYGTDEGALEDEDEGWQLVG